MREMRLALLVLAVPTFALAAPTGKEVLARQEAAQRTATFQARATLTTVMAGRSAARAQLRIWRQGDVSVIRVGSPRTTLWQGTEVRLREGDARVRRLDDAAQRRSFLGSAFTVADLLPMRAADHDAKVVAEVQCPHQLEKMLCHQLELTPATPAVAARSGVSRTVAWIRWDLGILVRAECYDAKGALWKRLVTDGVRQIDARSNKWAPTVLRIEDVVAKSTSVLELREIEVDAPIEPGRLSDTP
jgi:Outer membrane lipoprotein-sorting protein